MGKKRIIGIDPGTKTTGWGVVEENQNKHTLLGFGAISPPPKITGHLRYLFIFEEIELILKSYQVDALSIETQYVDKNVQSAIKLGMARGIIVLAALRLKVPVFEYAPTKIKQAVTGKGSASKAQVGGMIKLLLNLKEIPEPDDIPDAIAAAICHIHYSRSPLCMNI